MLDRRHDLVISWGATLLRQDFLVKVGRDLIAREIRHAP